MAHRAIHTVKRTLRTTRDRVLPGSNAKPGPSTTVAAKRSEPSTKSTRPRIAGMVEQFTKGIVVGWISVPEDEPPVRVDLMLGKLRAASTYATPAGDLEERNDKAPAAVTGQPLPAAAQAIPSPGNDDRNAWVQIRRFSFRIPGIWQFVKRSTRISIGIDGRPLPIYGHGMYLTPQKNGRESVDVLRNKLEKGYVFSQTGRLQLSKQLDREWQDKVMSMYERTRAILLEHYGYDVFFIYGTLLGAVREGGYIGHDIDFDAAFISRHSSPRAAARELHEIALTLVEQGLDVECRMTALHIHDSKDSSARIDLFHLFFNEKGELGFPFGIAGTTTITRDDWDGTREIDFPGGRGLIPKNAEQMVEHIYGADWRRPKPGFNWRLDRTTRAHHALTTPAERSKVYWTNFYARTEYTSGSTFSTFVEGYPGTPVNIIDIGCGDGRDSCAFGSAGRTALGIDQSEVGVEHAAAHAAARGVGERVAFQACDVADAQGFHRVLNGFRERVDGGPILYYMRFFLHAIPEDVQTRLMATISEFAQPGDMLAAEFRTDKDAEIAKVHGKHYRRFQNAETFSATLRGSYGFEIVHEEEGTGLSPYGEEDPVLYRVIARR